MRKPLQNIGASVRARLLNLAKERNHPFDLLLTRYTLERLLYRLSSSKHRESFVLKGAMLMTSWIDDPHRPTRDLDLLGFGDSDPEAILGVFREICAVKADDAVVFDVSALVVDRVRDELEYGGLRIKTNATVDGARVRVLVDIGFGDATEPGLTEIELSVLLDQPAPRLRAYPFETVIAEKFQAMVILGRANSRMKDFYDIWILARSHEFEDDRLARAIAATFARRKTEIPVERPDALTPAFAEDATKQQQWNAFLEDVAVNPGSLAEVTGNLAAFLMPHASKALVLRSKSGSDHETNHCLLCLAIAPCSRHSGMRLGSAFADLRCRPGIHTHDRGYGFRARASGGASADPLARPGMTILMQFTPKPPRPPQPPRPAATALPRSP